MTHAWDGYVRYAWGADELQPLTRSGVRHGQLGGLGASIIDAVSTLWLMDLREEFQRYILLSAPFLTSCLPACLPVKAVLWAALLLSNRRFGCRARDWIERSLDFEIELECSLFEVIIRVLGGLVSAHQLSGDKLLLARADDLADRLLPAFDTPSGIPGNDATLPRTPPGGGGGNVSLAQLGSNLLELGALSALTRNDKYAKAAERGLCFLHAAHPQQVDIFLSSRTRLPLYRSASPRCTPGFMRIPLLQGLLPSMVEQDTGRPLNDLFTIGAPADSYYEGAS